jgi:hypothetical protein
LKQILSVRLEEKTKSELLALATAAGYEFRGEVNASALVRDWIKEKIQEVKNAKQT